MSKKPDFMTDEQWAIELQIREEEEAYRKNLYEQQLKENPPLPPWMKFPDAGMVDMCWSMGGGESYLKNYVFNYFQNASPEAIKRYKEKYPEPEGWKGWYDS